MQRERRGVPDILVSEQFKKTVERFRVDRQRKRDQSRAFSLGLLGLAVVMISTLVYCQGVESLFLPVIVGILLLLTFVFERPHHRALEEEAIIAALDRFDARCVKWQRERALLDTDASDDVSGGTWVDEYLRLMRERVQIVHELDELSVRLSNWRKGAR